MGELPITQIGQEVAEFFVFYCEGEQYVSFTEKFHQAKTRQILIQAIHSFVYLGESIQVQHKRLHITPSKWTTLCQFITHANISDVRQLYTVMLTSIAKLEIEKIHKLEQSLISLYGGLERKDRRRRKCQ